MQNYCTINSHRIDLIHKNCFLFLHCMHEVPIFAFLPATSTCMALLVTWSAHMQNYCTINSHRIDLIHKNCFCFFIACMKYLFSLSYQPHPQVWRFYSSGQHTCKIIAQSTSTGLIWYLSIVSVSSLHAWSTYFRFLTSHIHVYGAFTHVVSTHAKLLYNQLPHRIDLIHKNCFLFLHCMREVPIFAFLPATSTCMALLLKWSAHMQNYCTINSHRIDLIHKNCFCFFIACMKYLFSLSYQPHPRVWRFYSRGQHTCKIIRTEGSVKKESNSLRIGLVHQYGRRFIVLEHKSGRYNVMWKCFIDCLHLIISIRFYVETALWSGWTEIGS